MSNKHQGNRVTSTRVQTTPQARSGPAAVVLALLFTVILSAIFWVYYGVACRDRSAQGLRYRSEHKWQEAARSFKEALYFDSRSSAVLTLLGEEYLGVGDFARSGIYLGRALDYGIIEGRAYVYLGAALACQGDYQKITDIASGSTIKNNDIDYVNLMKQLSNAMFPSCSSLAMTPIDEDLLKESTEKVTDTLFYRVHLGVINIYRGNFDSAEGIFRALLSECPNDSYMHCYLGLALLGKGNKVEALLSLTKALQLDRGNTVASQYMGALYTERGLYDEAYKALKVSQCLSPQSPGAWFYLGELELKREQYEEARGYYEQSMLLQPNHGMVHQRLGEVYEKLQLYERAAEEGERKKTLGGPLFIMTPPRFGQGCRPLW